MNRSNSNIIFLTILLFLIVGTMIWQYTNRRVITLFPNNDYQTLVQSDSYVLGGTSKATASVKGDKLIIDCEIITSSYEWPFCNLTIPLGTISQEAEGLGTDLNHVDFIHVKARYVDHPDLTFRVQMRNYNATYSKPEVIESWKFLSTEFISDSNNPTYTIPMSALQVPNWWLNYNRIPLSLSMPEYDNIMFFELATGNGMQEGHYQIEIEEIKLVGKHFSDAEVYRWLVFVLVFTLFSYLLNSIRLHRLTVKKQREQVFELSQINQFLESKNESLQDKINVDALTGVLNRHAAESIFPMLQDGDSLIIMDIDHFKSINDNYGHDIGDKVLAVFAHSIRSRLRKNDYFIRWGGEEFVGICPQSSVLDAEKVAEKCRTELKKTVWPEDIAVTCSFGVAEMSYGESVEMLIKRADAALYKAKNAGRDRVELA